MTMWSFFSSDPAKNFPFEVGEIVGGLESFSVWSLHNGKRKVSAALFSSHNRNLVASVFNISCGYYMKCALISLIVRTIKNKHERL